MKKLFILSLIIILLQSCSSEPVYSYVVKNDTDSTIEIVFVSDGFNGIGEIAKEWKTIVQPGEEAYCYEHIAEPKNIVNGKMQELTEFKYINSIEVYSGDRKAKVDYLSYDMGLYNIKGTLGSDQGAYTILVEESDF
jgi:hypothetical protein